MQSALYHLATGVHASVYAYRKPASTNHGQSSGAADCPDGQNPNRDHQGPPGWGVVKIVRAGPSGKMRGSKPHNVLREVLILQKARHPNVVKIIDYAWSESVWEHQLALPLLAITLRALLDSPTLAAHPNYQKDDFPDLSRLSMTSTHTPSPLDILFRSTAFQLLSALAYLHNLGIAHRDIKPENIMLDWDGSLVLVDFGIAWDDEAEDWGGEWKEDQEGMCCEVGTGPYRAPELLFGPLSYNPQALDLWAAGCVLAEFFTPPLTIFNPAIDPLYGSYDDMNTDTPASLPSLGKQTLFDSTYGDLGLAGSIFGKRGSPNAESWPTFNSLPDASKISFTHQQPKPLRGILPGLNRIQNPNLSETLLDSLLALSPARRMSAASALESEVFGGPVSLPARLLKCEEYGKARGGLRSMNDAEGRETVALLAEVMGSAKRRWESMQ